MFAKLVIDMGNSGTRCAVLVDVPGAGTREESFNIPNTFAEVPEGYKVPAEYNADTSVCFKPKFTMYGQYDKVEQCEGVTYIHGDVIAESMGASVLRPSTRERKAHNITTPLTYCVALLRAYNIIKNFTSTPLSQLDITWKVLLLLPPMNVSADSKDLERTIRSIESVKYTFPDIELTNKIDTLLVKPEAVCAYIGTYLSRGNTINMGMESLIKEDVLVLDIGAGTTDLVLMGHGKAITNSMNTINTAGNNVRAKLQISINQQYGFKPDVSTLERAMITGKIMDGSKELDVTDMINDAKKHVAREICNEITDYLEGVSLNMRTVNKLLVCGGGSQGGDAGTDIAPIGDYIIDFLRDSAPNIALVPSPTRIVSQMNESGEYQNIAVPVNPRQLNLLGAVIAADAMDKM